MLRQLSGAILLALPFSLCACASESASSQNQPLTPEVNSALTSLLSDDATTDRQGDLQSAFERDADIWVIAPTGGTPVRLTTHPGFDGQPDWSPESDKIVFTSARSGFLNIWLMSDLPDFTVGVADKSWSPAGEIAQTHS